MAKKGETIFDPKVHLVVDKYLEERCDTYEAIQTYERARLKVQLPTIEDYALYIGVHKDTLYDWEKKEGTEGYEDQFIGISDALGRIMTVQKQRLLNMGLSGEYNPTIAKLALSANHGLKERSDVTTDDEPITNSIQFKKFDEPNSEL